MAPPSLPPGTTTPSPGTGSETPPAATVPDEDPGVDLPLTMSASVILTNLPKDASQALEEVEALDSGKGMLRLGYTVMVGVAVFCDTLSHMRPSLTIFHPFIVCTWIFCAGFPIRTKGEVSGCSDQQTAFLTLT